MHCWHTGFAGASSQDYDSGAYDMCSCTGPPVSLYKLLEAQNPDMLQMYMLAVESHNCIDVLQTADAVSSSFTLESKLLLVTGWLLKYTLAV